ncbi:CDP-alcohol phosphatidyltransferase family protein [Pararhodobacter sp. SW119]|uniref:CDP-alcohol phosphatidyltransferase family protein n=1 Tax=Pararhodobacter sp. SW119 TaxID=2780075 RepID=UPI001ADEE55B|nr:CDP-alcohol phosphatidyltransferase family protein [Pararhodobacter sp. SW119]
MADLSTMRQPDPFARVQRQAMGILVIAAAAALATTHGLVEWAGVTDSLAAPVVTGILCLGGGLLILAGLKPAHHPHGRLGLANAVTILRAAAIAAIAGLVAVPETLVATGWALAGMAALILALDGVDGWAARRSGLASRFGARLDVETDVAFALVTAALAIAAGKVGVWFLVLGLVRPAFLFAARLLPALRGELRPSQRRRTVAGAQMAVQVALLAPVVTPPASGLLGVCVLAVVLWSFTVDIRALLCGKGRAA